MKLNEPGTLDLEFGNNGIASITLPNYLNPSVLGVSIIGTGADRKIYFFGRCQKKDSDNIYSFNAYLLGRLNSDGTPDSTFGDAGVVIGRFPGDSLTKVEAMDVQADGKIVLYGVSSFIFPFPVFARYHADGTLDTTFGNQGYAEPEIYPDPPAVQQPIEASSNESTALYPRDIAQVDVKVLPDGKIVACTTYEFPFSGGQSAGMIIRLNEDGSLDIDFNQLGYALVFHPEYPEHVGGSTSASAFLVQADGKYVVSGVAVNRQLPEFWTLFARLDNIGNPDLQFGTNGYVLFPYEDDLAVGYNIWHLVSQPNQRILGVGGTHQSALMISLEPSGEPNIQFNAGKPLLTTLDPDKSTVWLGSAIQSNGRIVVVGGVGETWGDYDLVVARYIDAQPDPTFNGGQGWVRMSSKYGEYFATGVALQDDGKIVVSARTANNQCTLLRLHA